VAFSNDGDGPAERDRWMLSEESRRLIAERMEIDQAQAGLGCDDPLCIGCMTRKRDGRNYAGPVERTEMPSELVEDLHRCFKDSGISYRALARMVGRSPGYLHNVFHGERCPRAETLLALYQHIKIPDKLMTELWECRAPESVYDDSPSMYPDQWPSS